MIGESSILLTNFYCFLLTEALQNERERKEALTKRPIDFEKEEETRKDETIKWLENHFGNASRSSNESREDDPNSPRNKYINVTIKANGAKRGVSPLKYEPESTYPSQPKLSQTEREQQKAPPKFYQGITDWSERKETAPRHFSSKAFQDELTGTLERNRMRHVPLRDEIRPSRYGKDENSKSDEEPRKKSSKNEIRYGSRGDLHYHHHGGSDDSRNLRTQREDLGYMSGSRNEIRPRHNSKDDLYSKTRKNHTNYLHREDSGYVKDSREDVRYTRNIPVREDSFNKDSGEDEKNLKYNNSAIQRDDSAYISSSTYFTEPRTPKTIPLRTPDSGIRSPSPEMYDADTLRPSAPHRRRTVEKNIRSSNGHIKSTMDRNEPAPDYSPPPRSRSISPVPSVKQQYNNGNQKKLYQKTRFASSSELSRPISMNTIETQTTPPPKKNKVTTTIGNSIRKLVGKLRSSSAERKQKAKAKRSTSPSANDKNSTNKNKTQPQKHPFNQVASNGSTYQQYNVIDGHIGQSQTPPSVNKHRDRESSIVSSSGRHDRTLERRVSSDNDTMAIPKQKYYLGEDPYLSMYGKENKYDGNRGAASTQHNRYRRQRADDSDAHTPSR